MIEKLQAQLDELVKAKEDHETLLITKVPLLQPRSITSPAFHNGQTLIVVQYAPQFEES